MGSIGYRHIKNVKKLLPKVEIAALRSQKNTINHEFTQIIDHEFYNISDAKSFTPDMIFITNPTFLHVETSLEFTNIVPGIFIEKPISDRLDKVQKLIDYNESSIIHVACPLRFHPTIKFLKDYLKNRHKILNIRLSSGSYLPEWRPGQDYRKLYCARKEFGGGVSLDLIHEIDYLRWIFGNIKEGYFGSSKVSDLDINSEDISYSIFKLESGGICELHLDYFRRLPERKIEVSTDNELIVADLIDSSIKICNSDGEKVINQDFVRNDMYVEELIYFLNCVKKSKKSFNDPVFAYDTLRYALYMRDNVGIVKE